MTDREREAFTTKDNIWPKPKYDQMVADGIPAPVALLIKKIRDSIPKDPQKLVGKTAREAQEIYIEAVGRVRDALVNVKTREDLTLGTALGDGKDWRKPLVQSIFTPAEYDKNRPSMERWSPEGKNLAIALGANKFVRALQVSSWDFVRAQRKVEISGWPAKKERTAQAGEKGKPEKYKRPMLDHVQREGVDYREGRDITPIEFRDAFGFRGGEFGKWLNQTDRQESLNHAYDALMDLANVLNVPPKALSLDGALGFAFGARGGGHASAHYEPVKVVMNLTKTRGAGALAHEWFHAMDDHFGRQAGDRTKVRPYASHGKFGDQTWDRETRSFKTREIGLRPEMIAAWEEVIDALERTPAGKRSEFSKEAQKLGQYWARPHEKAARAFESWVQDRVGQDGLRTSQYLVHSTEAALPGVYPQGTEREAINAAFDKFFQTVKTKATEKGVALYKREQDFRPANPLNRKTLDATVAAVQRSLSDAAPTVTYDNAAEASRYLGMEVPADARAFYLKGEVHIISDMIGSKRDLAEAIVHEQLRHHGFRAFLGKDYRATMRQAWVNRDVRAKALELFREGYTDLKVFDKDGNIRRDAKPGDIIHAADEAIAHLADGGWKSGVMDRIVAAIRRVLRRAGMGLEFSNAEIRDMISAAAQQVVDGKRKSLAGQVRGALAPAFQRVRHGGQEPLAPNGKPSKLNAKQYEQVRSAPFRRWAGNWMYDPKRQAEVVEVDPSALDGVNLKDADALEKWVLENLPEGGSVHVDSTGSDVGFSNTNLKASIKRRGAAQRKAFAGLRDLIAKAEYFDFEPTDERHAHRVVGQDVYFAAMSIGGNDYSVKIKVDVAKKDKAETYKDHKVSEIQIAPVVSRGQSSEEEAPRTSRSGASSGAIRTVDIGTLTGGVKPSPSTAVLDENGEPLVVYHGTTRKRGGADISVFDPTKSDLGVHFGTAEQAEMFSDNADGAVYPVFLNARNLLRLEDKGGFYGDYVAPQLVDRGILSEAEADPFINGDRSDRELAKLLMRKGYDGVVYLNRREGVNVADHHQEGFEQESTDKEFLREYPGAKDSYIAFSPTQIKSATGNSGAFDGENPDIRYKRAPSTIITDEDKIRLDPPQEARPYTKEGFTALKERVFQQLIDEADPYIRRAGELGKAVGERAREMVALKRNSANQLDEMLVGTQDAPAIGSDNPADRVPGQQTLQTALQPISGSQTKTDAFEVIVKHERMIALGTYRPEFTPQREAMMKAGYGLAALTK